MVNMYSVVSQAVKNAGMSAIFVGSTTMPGDIAIGLYGALYTVRKVSEHSALRDEVSLLTSLAMYKRCFRQKSVM